MYKSYEPSMSAAAVLRTRPDAVSHIRGSEKYPRISGSVKFYQTRQGVLTLAEIAGLPQSSGECSSRIFGFHIHEGTSCSGNESDPFADTMTHYDPAGCEHPYHAGDFPPLFGNSGVAVMMFLSDRFTVREIIGKTVVIHGSPDDFTSQPAGNAGEKIACGEIVR